MFESRITLLSQVETPSYGGHRIMMMPFDYSDVRNTLPHYLEAWKPIIEDLIQPFDLSGVGYLTLDESFVRKEETQRRPGLHVDGVGGWGGNDGGWGGSQKKSQPPVTGGWGGATGSWGGSQPLTRGGWGGSTGSWGGAATKGKTPGMILLSSHTGCRGWDQEFEGFPDANGDCEHLREQCRDDESIVFEANHAYYCLPLTVHESLPMKSDTYRQFLRLSFPNTCPWYEGYTENPLGIQPAGEILPARTDFMNYRP